jgi:basic amino acid/polyamine antiporter, APA family
MATLKRTTGVAGAVLLGLGSIIGTGVFVSIGIAADVAGPAVLAAVVIAALVATANGLNSAQLAAAHPVSGGTYEYGYRLLNPVAGFTAGWMFLCAKTASAATAALGFAAYLSALLGFEGRWVITGIGVGAAAALTAVVLSGLRRSNALNAVLVALTLSALGLFVVIGAPHLQGARFQPLLGEGPGLLEAAALMFVAFTGYGRIATMGEEIRDPARNIPRAMVVTLAVSALVYVAVAVVLVGSNSGVSGLATGAPLQQLAREFAAPGVAWWIGVGAMIAMLGVLLNLVLGLSRVWLAMGRRGDVPGLIGRVNVSGTTPVPAVVLTGLTIVALVLIGDVRLTWSFSAFTVLIYYAITNAAALRLKAEQRRFPRWVAFCGLAACLFLAFWVEWRVWLAGLGVIAAGLLWHAIARRLAARNSPPQADGNQPKDADQ